MNNPDVFRFQENRTMRDLDMLKSARCTENFENTNIPDATLNNDPFKMQEQRTEKDKKMIQDYSCGKIKENFMYQMFQTPMFN